MEAARRRPLESARKRRKRVPVSPEEEARLVLLGETRALIYNFAALTGLRRRELGTLRWRDIDFERRVVRITASRAKSRKDQSVPIRQDLLDALQEFRWRSPAGKPMDPVFPSKLFPQIRTFWKDLEAAGIAREDESGRVVDFHGLRGTFISGLARSGVHPRVAQALARHSSIELTMKAYTDLALLDLRGAVESLPALVPVPEGVAAGKGRARRRGRSGGASS